MTGTAGREVALELGGERYILRVECDVIMRIEEALDTNMFKLGQRIGQLDFRLEELIRTVRVILESNGHETAKASLAAAIARQGAQAVVMPLIAYVRAYTLGTRAGIDDEAAVTQDTAEPAAAAPAGEAPSGTPA